MSAFVFEDLLGKIPKSTEIEKDNEFASITFQDGTKMRMYHSQDCCESVRIEDVIGDPENLIGHPLLMAEVVTNENGEPVETDEFCYGSCTWSFFKFANLGGYLTIRWYGTSNGYYSEDVDVTIVHPDETRTDYPAWDRREFQS